jgi:hypothetical protein
VLAYYAFPRWYMESNGGMILTGENQRIRRKTCPSATLSTTNPTWIDSGSNLSLRGERLATNDLSHGTAQEQYLSYLCQYIKNFLLLAAKYCIHPNSTHSKQDAHPHFYSCLYRDIIIWMTIILKIKKRLITLMSHNRNLNYHAWWLTKQQ